MGLLALGVTRPGVAGCDLPRDIAGDVATLPSEPWPRAARARTALRGLPAGGDCGGAAWDTCDVRGGTVAIALLRRGCSAPFVEGKWWSGVCGTEDPPRG